ncbi:hypothetical protein [Microbulbifer sp. TRSA005]|uniref:hypothetical protein n=1 Tax=unclassified Microbulbifer TaxID=2619833 RepID=UPI0040399D7F
MAGIFLPVKNKYIGYFSISFAKNSCHTFLSIHPASDDWAESKPGAGKNIFKWGMRSAEIWCSSSADNVFDRSSLRTLFGFRSHAEGQTGQESGLLLPSSHFPASVFFRFISVGPRIGRLL